MRKIKKYSNFSIRTSMIFVFILLMLSTVGVIGYFVFSNWFSSAEKTIEIMAEDMNYEIDNKVNAFVNLPLHINEMNSKFIENGIVNIDNETERDSFFVGVMKFLKDEVVYSFSIGIENGEYYGARRNENNEIEIMRNNTDTGGNSWYYSVTEDLTAGKLVVEAGKFDVTTRDWYKAAKETQKPVFSPIYKHFVMDDLTVSAAYPIFDKDGGFQGVLGTHITLTKINKFLQEIVQDKNGLAFIIDKNSGELIANSLDIENFKTLEGGIVKRMMIEEIENNAIAQAYQTYQSTAENNIRVPNEGDKLYISFTEYNKAGLDWLVITAFPESLLVAGIFTNMKLAILLTLIALLVSIVTYWLLTNKFFKPIDSFIETTEKFSQGDLSERATILRNDEIGRISISLIKWQILYMSMFITSRKRSERERLIY
ncbi:hypothetical protein H1D32_04540 [Anaerobacillus sp. CMMVII]|uniref:cache domain-containing protein n=1 Tax=Anaerobacillus sp. CMMVII TaxID=2755588 RepID=UPI0021B7650A|nr:cache domain-containing protein [Anaerobacillus sp. CMMVII]MCT8137070.1 hypothetical protein [Anaerobacillus sp. CMMVII]